MAKLTLRHLQNTFRDQFPHISKIQTLQETHFVCTVFRNPDLFQEYSSIHYYYKTLMQFYPILTNKNKAQNKSLLSLQEMGSAMTQNLLRACWGCTQRCDVFPLLSYSPHLLLQSGKPPNGDTSSITLQWMVLHSWAFTGLFDLQVVEVRAGSRGGMAFLGNNSAIKLAAF